MTNYSIIIPHRNSPKLLQRLLASIPKREDVEVIVIDDDEGRGGGWARNQGLKRASGDWLLFADADDYYNEGFLDVLDEYKDTDNIDMLFFGFNVINSKTHAVETPPTVALIQNYDGSADAERHLRYCLHSPWCRLIRHDFLRCHNLHFEETSIANDLFFGLMAGHFAGNIAVDKRVLYTYVHYPASQTNRNWDMAKVRDYLGITIRANAFFDNIGQSSLHRRLVNLWIEAVRGRKWHRLRMLTRCFVIEHRALAKSRSAYVEFAKTQPSCSR